jgi:hypothetical protein
MEGSKKPTAAKVDVERLQGRTRAGSNDTLIYESDVDHGDYAISINSDTEVVDDSIEMQRESSVSSTDTTSCTRRPVIPTTVSPRLHKRFLDLSGSCADTMSIYEALSILPPSQLLILTVE